MPNERIRYADVIAYGADGDIILDTGGNYRVWFSYNCWMNDRGNSAVIRIFGLSESQERSVLRGACIVKLNAGNEATHGQVFQGELVDGYHTETDKTEFLCLVLRDGDAFLSSYINYSVCAGESIGSLITSVAACCSSPLEIGYITPAAYTVKLARGAAFLGSPTDVLSAAAKSLNAAVFVRNGQLYVLGANDNPSGTVITVDEYTGVIGIPTVDSFYSSFCHEIDSSLAVGRLISMGASFGSGIYRISHIYGTGDTRDGDWYISIMAIGQNGDKPNATALTQNIWR